MSGSGDYHYEGPTPFMKAGRVMGAGVSAGLNWLGVPTNKPMFTDVGGRFGHAIGGIFGSGDYQVGGGNSIFTNGKELPAFSAGGHSNFIAHREYIKDIVSAPTANTFQNENFILNPGLASSFPWLATIAQNYEQYRIRGCVFEFKSTSADALNSTNTALGQVIMATDYNPASVNYTNKQQMENSQFAQSAKPSLSMLHGIECDSKQTPVSQLFIRTGAVPSGQDPRWYDLANFQIATNGFQGTNVVCGELWVTYIVEFFKPQIPQTFGGSTDSLHIRRTSLSTTSLNFADIGLFIVGNIDHSITSSVLTLTNLEVGNKYMFTYIWRGSSNVTNNVALAYTGTKVFNSISNAADGLTSTDVKVQKELQSMTVVQTLEITSSVVTVTLSGGLQTAAGPYAVDVFVNLIDSTVSK